jgi:uncharacterized protein YndB with AHSA1/START domain
MSQKLEFIVDKPTKTVTINREFAAELPLVWDAYTKAEILDQWWAPKPWSSKTKVLNFEPGGRRFYAMVSPEGVERWSVQRYITVTPKTNFKLYNTFSDENENPELPGSFWDLKFAEATGEDGEPVTTVTVTIYNESLDRMEKLIEMGFKEGFTMTMASLDELLATLSKRK